jgi:hypothetical protein
VKAALTPAPGKEQVGQGDQNYYDHDYYQGPHFFLHLPSFSKSFPKKSTGELTEGNLPPIGGSSLRKVLYRKRCRLLKYHLNFAL